MAVDRAYAAFELRPIAVLSAAVALALKPRLVAPEFRDELREPMAVVAAPVAIAPVP